MNHISCEVYCTCTGYPISLHFPVGLQNAPRFSQWSAPAQQGHVFYSFTMTFYNSVLLISPRSSQARILWPVRLNPGTKQNVRPDDHILTNSFDSSDRVVKGLLKLNVFGELNLFLIKIF